MYSRSIVETSIFTLNFYCKLFKGKNFHFFMMVTWFGFFYFKAILRNSEIIEEFCKLMISLCFPRRHYSFKNLSNIYAKLVLKWSLISYSWKQSLSLFFNN